MKANTGTEESSLGEGTNKQTEPLTVEQKVLIAEQRKLGYELAQKKEKRDEIQSRMDELDKKITRMANKVDSKELGLNRTKRRNPYPRPRDMDQQMNKYIKIEEGGIQKLQKELSNFQNKRNDMDNEMRQANVAISTVEGELRGIGSKLKEISRRIEQEQAKSNEAPAASAPHEAKKSFFDDIRESYKSLKLWQKTLFWILLLPTLSVGSFIILTMSSTRTTSSASAALAPSAAPVTPTSTACAAPVTPTSTASAAFALNAGFKGPRPVVNSDKQQMAPEPEMAPELGASSPASNPYPSSSIKPR